MNKNMQHMINFLFRVYHGIQIRIASVVRRGQVCTVCVYIHLPLTCFKNIIQQLRMSVDVSGRKSRPEMEGLEEICSKFMAGRLIYFQNSKYLRVLN